MKILTLISIIFKLSGLWIKIYFNQNILISTAEDIGGLWKVRFKHMGVNNLDHSDFSYVYIITNDLIKGNSGPYKFELENSLEPSGYEGYILIPKNHVLSGSINKEKSIKADFIFEAVRNPSKNIYIVFLMNPSLRYLKRYYTMFVKIKSIK